MTPPAASCSCTLRSQFPLTFLRLTLNFFVVEKIININEEEGRIKQGETPVCMNGEVRQKWREGSGRTRSTEATGEEGQTRQPRQPWFDN